MALLKRSALIVLLYYFLLSSYNGNGVEGDGKLSKKDLKLEKQLKLLNKPAVKTVQMKYGDIYDCIDFYKQPAFNHPLLKNHTYHYQMRPSSVPKVLKENEHSTTNTKTREMGLNRVGCPVGTVPIRRTTKDDLVRAKVHRERYGSNYSVLTTENPGTHYATLKTTFDPNKKYNGGGATVSVYNPSVSNSQYSSARMKIQNNFDSIQFGWTVNPTLYGNNLTHFFMYLNAGQSRCFNTQCPGFVIVNTDFPIDAVLNPVSHRGESPTYVIDFLIYRDVVNGNWWLAIGPDNTQMGFWPQRIFTGLADMAATVEWGGEVFSPPDLQSPPMGSSAYLKKKDTRYDAFFKYLTTINGSNKIVDAVNTQTFVDCSFYEVKDEGYVDKVNKIKYGFGHLMLFGGPGGATGD